MNDQRLCPFEFRGPDCGYQGRAAGCNRTQACCVLIGNLEHFGGGALPAEDGTRQESPGAIPDPAKLKADLLRLPVEVSQRICREVLASLEDRQ